MLANVPDGRFRVTLPDGDHLAIHIKAAGKDSKLNGSRIVSTRINGDEWMGVAHIPPLASFASGAPRWLAPRPHHRLRATLDAAKTEDEWLVAGLAFAQEGSQCFFCGRDLDTPESLPWLRPRLRRQARPAVGRQSDSDERSTGAGGGTSRPCRSFDALDRPGLRPRSLTSPPPPERRFKRGGVRGLDANEIARAQAEGRSRTYEEIFGDD